MRKLLILTILFGLTYSNNYFSGLSHATSDNLDALSKNPAGLGIDRGLQFGFGIDQEFIDSKKVGLGLKFKEYGASLILDEKGNYQYVIGSGSYFSKANLYFGQTYSSEKDLATGLLFRPLNWLSSGLTYNYNFETELHGLDLGVAFRPLGNRLTFSLDVSNDDILNLNDNIDFSTNLNVKIFDGFNLLAGYDNIDGVKAGLSFNTSNFNILGYGSNAENSHPTMSFRYSSQNQNGIEVPSFKMDDDKTPLNFVKLELNHVFIEEPIKQKKGFNFEIPELNPLSAIMGGSSSKYYQLQNFLDKMEMITNDDKVDGMIINLKSIGGGISKLMDIREALQKFKDSGKKIIIYADYISNSAYMVASVADEIYVPELSGVDLRGLHIEVEFYKEFLDTLGIAYEVEQISPYKSALDPFIRNSMSPEMKENLGQLFDDIYKDYVEAISKGRGWTIKHTKSVIDGGPYREDEAIKIGLITNTMYPDEFDKYIKKYNDKTVVSMPLFTFKENDEYVEDWVEKKDKIAVIYAVGGIISGKSNPGPGGSTMMGDETIIKAIKEARENKEIDAIVLRVDSGGGSALASDMMWREVYKTTVEDTSNIKPFIVSMSDAAASGGYYIACQADKIIADETTLTGSIGVYFVRINFSQLLNRIGIYSENIKKGERADFASSSHLLTDEERAEAFENIMNMYNVFKQRVIDGRDNLNDLNELDQVALGRVWTGSKAKDHGLVDEIGGLHDAIEIAKTEAGINQNIDVEIVELPEVRDFSFFDFFNDDETNIVTQISFNEIFPEEMAKQLEALNIIPVIMNDEIQFIMPYNISLN